jgi:protein O-mannosyl-transferase
MRLAPGGSSRRNLRDGLTALALAVVTFTVFAPALDCDFVDFDDPGYVTNTPQVTAGLSDAGVRWAFTAFNAFYWHPLTWLSLQLDATLSRTPDGKPNPWGFHFTNVLFHSGSAAFLFLALRALTGAYWRSAVAALLFAVHPLRVESVAWVAERKDVLSVFFGMLALWAYAAYSRHPSVKSYLLVLLAFALSLMSKPMLVTLPCLLLVLDWWPLGRLLGHTGEPGSWRRLVVEKLPLLALALAATAITIYAQSVEGAVADLDRFSPAVRLENAAISYVTYLGMLAWPVNLAVFYPHPAYPWGGGLFVEMVAAAAVVLIGLSAGAVALRRRAPYFLAGWLWYLGTLLPVIGLTQAGDQALADRFTYFPQIGLLIAICWGVAELARGRTREVLAFAAVVAVVLAVLTRKQLTVWQDSVTLWNHDLKVARSSPAALTNLAIALEQSDPATAEKYLREALALDNESVATHINLGNLLMRRGRLEEAADELLVACELREKYAEPRTQLGEIRFRQGKVEEAIVLHREAIRLKPGLSAAHCNLGIAEAARGNLVEAADNFREALRLQPDFPEAHCGLGEVLFRQHRSEEGLKHLREAVRINPGYGEGHLFLGLALEGRGELSEAAWHFEQAVRSNPGLTMAWSRLAAARAHQGRTEEADFCRQRALEQGTMSR